MAVRSWIRRSPPCRYRARTSPRALVSTHHSLPSLREGRATARGGLLLVRCSLFRCLDTLACPRPSPLVTSRPSRREGESSTIPLVLRCVEINALREVTGRGNAVKVFGSRIRENLVVSGIARSLTTSATTYTHAFSRVKKSLTAIHPAQHEPRHAD